MCSQADQPPPTATSASTISSSSQCLLPDNSRTDARAARTFIDLIGGPASAAQARPSSAATALAWVSTRQNHHLDASATPPTRQARTRGQQHHSAPYTTVRARHALLGATTARSGDSVPRASRTALHAGMRFLGSATTAWPTPRCAKGYSPPSSSTTGMRSQSLPTTSTPASRRFATASSAMSVR